MSQYEKYRLRKHLGELVDEVNKTVICAEKQDAIAVNLLLSKIEFTIRDLRTTMEIYQ